MTFRIHSRADPILPRFYIPFVRTLLSASTETIPREYVHSTVREDGNEGFTESTEQVPRERVLKYLPVGNYKWCVFFYPSAQRRQHIS